MSKETHSPVNILPNPQGKDKLKDLITKEVNQLTDGIEIVKNSIDDILQELLKSIGIVDFMLLAFPESEAVLNRYNALQIVFRSIEGLSESQQIEFDKLKTEWKKITLKTAFMFPAIVFSIFFVLNALIWGEKSSGAVPFGTMFAWYSYGLAFQFHLSLLVVISVSTSLRLRIQ